MKKVLTFLLGIFMNLSLSGQSTLLSSTNLQVPNVENLSSVASPKPGMVVYNEVDGSFYTRNDVQWQKLQTVSNATTAPMIEQIYLQLTGVPGDITTGRHSGQSLVFDISHSITNSTSLHGGSRAGTAAGFDITITKARGNSSTTLKRSVVLSQFLPSASLLFYDSEGTLYYRIEMEKVIIKSIESVGPYPAVMVINTDPSAPPGTPAGSAPAILEKIVLHFARVEYKDEINGSSFAFDIELNQEFDR